MNKVMNIMLRIILSFALLALVACSSKPVAGGTSEETNTIAGVLVRANGTPVVGAWVEVRSANAITQSTTLAKKLTANVNDVVNVSDVLRDTTDNQGHWSVKPSSLGSYVLLAGDTSGLLAMRSVIWMDSVRTRDTLRAGVSFSTQVSCRTGSAIGSLVSIPGTHFSAKVDSLGRVSFPNLPQGVLSLMVQSPDPYRYADAVWSLNLKDSVKVLRGPFTNLRGLDSASRWIAKSSVDVARVELLEMPMGYEYQVCAWWSFDSWIMEGNVQLFQDSRGRSGDGVVYGAGLVDGVVGKALSLENGSQFAVVEDPGTVFQTLGKFSVEAWVNLRSLPDTAGYQMNLVGQIGFAGDQSKDLFSLAVVRDSLGAQPAFAFLLSNGNSGALDTSERVVALEPVSLNQWTYVLATWDSTQACVFVNGVRSNCRVLGAKTFVPSPEAIYFGKENFSVILDEVRIIGFNLDAADANFRWLRRFQ